MKIKSLLLGSAAALAAVSGARAADAVVIAEPEPVEYVRVCDAYGVGYFYIPGTETCLRIGGEVRYNITANSHNSIYDTTPYNGRVFQDGWGKEARGRFFIDAREQTEWGTLRGYIRVDASRGTNDGFSNSVNNIRTNKAWLSIGDTHQIKMGWEDSAWAFTPNGGKSGYGSGSDNGHYYGYQQRNMIQYHYYGPNGWFGSLSLEDDNDTGEGYMPDVVVRAGVSQGWGGVWGVLGYDESFDDGDVDGGFGAQIGLRLDVPSFPGSYFVVRGFYADGDHAYTTGAPDVIGGYFSGNPLDLGGVYGSGEWSIMAAYNHTFNAQWSGLVSFQWFNDLYFQGTDVSSDVDAWSVEVAAVWTPVQNFAIRTEVIYDSIDAPEGFDGGDLDGTVSGFIRFSRFF